MTYDSKEQTKSSKYNSVYLNGNSDCYWIGPEISWSGFVFTIPKNTFPQWYLNGSISCIPFEIELDMGKVQYIWEKSKIKGGMMKDEKITRRSFLIQWCSFLVVGLVGLAGCGKKPEEKPPAKPPTPGEMTMEEKQKYVFANCICKKCPSYVECGEKAGFCLVGKSKCIKEKKGCICPDCPVTKKMELKWGYYCTDGSAMEMMEKEKTQG